MKPIKPLWFTRSGVPISLRGSGYRTAYLKEALHRLTRLREYLYLSHSNSSISHFDKGLKMGDAFSRL